MNMALPSCIESALHRTRRGGATDRPRGQGAARSLNQARWDAICCCWSGGARRVQVLASSLPERCSGQSLGL